MATIPNLQGLDSAGVMAAEMKFSQEQMVEQAGFGMVASDMSAKSNEVGEFAKAEDTSSSISSK